MQRRKVTSMTTQRMRGGGNQAQGRKKEEHIGRFKLFLHKGINNVHEFLHTYNATCVHVTVITVHTICEGLLLFLFADGEAT